MNYVILGTIVIMIATPTAQVLLLFRKL